MPVASTSTETSSTEPRRAKKPAATASTGAAPPLGKFLASSEKHIRDKAVASLARFLRGKQKANHDNADEQADNQGDADWSSEYVPDSRLQPLEMAKLWKGIFYCFWMSDKPLVQQALATDLAQLTLEVRPKLKAGQAPPPSRPDRLRAALCYLRAFWQATTREWANLDRLRLDKYYMLIRRFVNVAFRLLEREQWDLNAVKEYNAMLTGSDGPLDVLNQRIPHSLAYHLSDIYVDELERVASSSSSAAAAADQRHDIPLVALLSPFLDTLSISPTSTMFSRVSDNVVKPIWDDAIRAKTTTDGGRANKRRKTTSSSASAASSSSLDQEQTRLEHLTYPGILARAVERTFKPDDDDDQDEHGSAATNPNALVGLALMRAVFAKGGDKQTTDVNRRRMYALVKDKEQAAGVEI